MNQPKTMHHHEDNHNPHGNALFAGENRIVWIVLMLIFAVRFLFALTVPLVPDEAYYWDWSRVLAFGYFDHPPMTSWLCRLSTMVFGHTVAGIRFVPAFSTLVLGGAMFLLSRHYLASPRAFLFFLLCTSISPLFGVGGLLLTPDIPLVLFWAIGMLCAYRALFYGSRACWVLLGVVCGMGMLSKYVFVVFGISLGTFILFQRNYYSRLTKPPACAAAIILTGIFLPNFLWNANNNWISMAFQMDHGISLSGFPRFDYFLEYLGGQAGVSSPFLFAALFPALVFFLSPRHRSPRIVFLFCFFLTPLVFFGLSSFSKRVEANWAAPAWLSGFLLLSTYRESLVMSGKKHLRLFVDSMAACTGVACIIILIHISSPVLPLAERSDPTLRIRGWHEWARQIHQIRKKYDPKLHLPVAANRYQEAALLSFYLPDHPFASSLNKGGRKNQYTLWHQRHPEAGERFIFIWKTADPHRPEGIPEKFSDHRLLGTAVRYRGNAPSETYGIFLCTRSFEREKADNRRGLIPAQVVAEMKP